ncbi:hypothetical protein K461DRAFT_293151 [Myriangium duriaei CBS 260.36]|uniref:Uncharacterized protein n=1 Tax=Myriangium duriaei CBS 260.36 TaxID=1168546 RepID=A0A9P4J1R2_9PEZI|nr:hypothetical protein K461DRAFT_293151 [Myriangium duriaei CBS 260.36]
MFFITLCTAFVALTAGALARNVVFNVRYIDNDGDEASETQPGAVMDNDAQAVLNNMVAWSNGRYRAREHQTSIWIENVNVVASWAATEGMWHDMYMVIADHVNHPPPDPNEGRGGHRGGRGGRRGRGNRGRHGGQGGHGDRRDGHDSGDHVEDDVEQLL